MTVETRTLNFRTVLALGAAALAVMAGMLGQAVVYAPDAHAYLSEADHYYIALEADIGVGPPPGSSYEEFALAGRQVAATVAESFDPLVAAAGMARQMYIHTNLNMDQAAGSVVNALRAYHPEMIPIIVAQGASGGVAA